MTGPSLITALDETAGPSRITVRTVMIRVAVVIALMASALPVMPADASTILFSDGFESGDLGAWSADLGRDATAVAVGAPVKSGAFAGRLTVASRRGSYALLDGHFGTTTTTTEVSAAIRLAAAGSKDVPLMSLRTSDGSTIASLVRAGGSSSLRVEYAGTFASVGSLGTGTWVTFGLKVHIDGASSTLDVMREGASVFNTTAPLGTSKPAVVRLGSDNRNAEVDVRFDDVSASGTNQAPPDTAPPDTTITSGPLGTVGSPDATFTFTSSEANSTFACRLNGSAWAGCTSPKSYTGLADGQHTFEVRATDPASNTDPTPAARTWTIDTSTPTDPVIVGAGDIAECNNPGDEATAALLDGVDGTVITMGDNVYPSGTATQFQNCYDPSWGQHRARTRPSTGNHDYDTANASGYFNYFGANAGDPATGYYSYNLGTWQLIALNSNCSQIGGCHSTSAQANWLRNVLANSSADCTLAYFHHPRFSSAAHGSHAFMEPLVQVLYDGGADVVLAGHDHVYERFAPQTPQGNADATYGIRHFTVGTGGKSLYGFNTPLPTSEVRHNAGYGVLRMTLRDGSYDWEFLSEPNVSFTDTGSTACHGAPQAPPPGPASFSDGFETGNFSLWTSVVTEGDGTAAVTSQDVHSGTYAARLTASASSGSKSYLRKHMGSVRSSMTASAWVKVDAEGASGSNVPLLRLFNGSERIVSLYRQNLQRDEVWVKHGGSYHKTSGTLPLGQWAKAELKVVADGAGADVIEVRLDGVLVYATSSGTLGAPGVTTLQLGNEVAGQAFDLRADEIRVE